MLKDASKVKTQTLQFMSTPGAPGVCPTQPRPPLPMLCVRRREHRSLVFLLLDDGKNGLGRGPVLENMISSDFKGLFCFQKGSNFQTASLPPLPAPSLGSLHHLLQEHHSFSGRGGEGREALAGQGPPPLFPKDVIHSQMSFPEAGCHTASCPLNPGIPSLPMTQRNGTKNRKHEPACVHLCTMALQRPFTHPVHEHPLCSSHCTRP